MSFFLNGALKTLLPTSRNFMNVRKGKQALLILDNAPCHPLVKILNAIDDDFRVMYLPPNITVLVQPMDQGVIEKLKRIYRKQFLRRLLLAENGEKGIAAFAKKLNMKDACYMLAKAGDLLERQSLKNAWNKLWPDLEGEKDFNDDHRRRLPTLSVNPRISKMR
ncbi:jerky protein homolog-like [Trichonephila clavipes]|nr:jerky protein homolog-like [Trichonephila clavipes]